MFGWSPCSCQALHQGKCLFSVKHHMVQYLCCVLFFVLDRLSNCFRQVTYMIPVVLVMSLCV